MHEIALMRGLLRQIEAVSKQNGEARIIQVNIWLGALSQMSADHFRDHYDQMTVGTCGADAEMHIEASDDPTHPDALHVLLQSVEIAEA